MSVAEKEKTGELGELEKRRIAPDEISSLCSQIALMLRSGLSVRDGVDALCSSYEGTRYGANFARLKQGISETGALADALESAGGYPAYMIKMVRIGELTGTLDNVCDALSAHYEREDELNRSVKNAVLYPSVLVVMMAIVIGILTIKVLPVFERVFAGLGSGVSAAASAAMDIGSAVGVAVLAAVAALVAAAATVAILANTKQRDNTLRLLCRIPAVKRAVKSSAAARFAGVSTILLKSGYDITAIDELTEDLAFDEDSRERIKRVGELMKDGAPFSLAASSVGIFDDVHERMIQVGASAGSLDSVMEKLAAIYERETDDAVNNAVSLIEPVIVAVLSVIVGGILLTVLLPLTGILSSML